MTVNHNRRAVCRAALAALLLPATSLRAVAAGWPERPIKWVVPYAAGTGPDITARIVGEAVGPMLGTAIVVENRAGAGGNIGAKLVARAEPDGYTWLYSGAPMAASMMLYAHPGYDVLKDFRHVGRISSSDTLLVVPGNSPVTSVKALLDKMRAAPGQLDYASGGVGTPSHLGVELMLAAAGARATHVPYKSAGESVNAVIGGQVAFAMPILSVAYPQVQAGKLRALAVCGTRRSPVLPGVPTLAEAGLAGVDLTSWGGLSLPAGTPDAIASRITDAVQRAMAQPQVVQALERNGGRADPSNVTAYLASFREEMARTETIMRKTGMKRM